MEDLIVIGAGTPLVVKLVEAINRKDRIWNLLGFVDDDVKKQGTEVCGYPVLGAIDVLESYPIARCACFIYGGVIHIRLRVLERVNKMGVHYATLVHPSVDLEFVSVGRDCVIQGGTWLQDNIVVGDHVGIGLGCIVGHDVTIEDCAWLGPRATILGRVTVKRAATLGAGCVIKGDLTIGEESLVGMGAIVVDDVPAGATVMGNPARVINRAGLRRRHPY